MTSPEAPTTDDDVEMPEDAPLAPGSELGEGLVVTSLLGEGGTAMVYEVEHRGLAMAAAVKVVKSNDPFSGDGRARLAREARVYRALHDPRVPRVFELGQLEDGTAFMVMEKVDGKTLAQALEAGPLPVREACTLAVELLDLLHVVHEHGIVHRDVKPQNVIVEQGEGGSFKLIDFGVCKPTGRALDMTAITRSGEIVGTPAYMAPEQLTGQTVDGRTDVHAVGVLLYELLTGHAPYGGSCFGEIVAAVLRDDPPQVHVLRPDVPRTVSVVVGRALAKQPAGRYRTAAEMRDALRAALTQVDEADLERLSHVPAPQDAEPAPANTGVRIKQTHDTHVLDADDLRDIAL